MLKQYSTGKIFKINAKNPRASWTLLRVGEQWQGTTPQDWGEHGGGGGVVPISDFIRLAGMQILIWWEVYLLIIN